jgi:glycosyltransferase involved in cell wall biosynthesis
MRILIVTQYFWPETFRINDLVAEFCSRGHTVTVLTGCPNYPEGEIFPEYKNNPAAFAKFGAANVIRVPISPRGKGALKLLINYASFALSATVLGWWNLRRKKFDIIFVCQLSPVTSGLPAIFFRHLMKIPVVFWVLDLWPETLEAVGIVRSQRVLKAVGFLVSFIYKRCDLILAQSRSFIPKIMQYSQPEKSIEYFPSWSDTQFDFSTVNPAKEVPSAEGVFNIMFAGNIGDAQDFPTILDAAECLKNDKSIRWLILGDGRVSAWVRSEVVRRGLSDCFLMLGRYSLDRMPSFFTHADVLLVSLKSESIFSMTIPGKLQSYLAAGIPVLAMLNGEGAEIVRVSGAGLSCPAGDALALVAAVKKMAAMDIKDRKEMGKLGLTISKKDFDRELLITRLLSWFEELSVHRPTT